MADRLEEKRNQESDRVAVRKWLDGAPKCFHKYQKQMYDPNTSYYSSLIGNLNLEIPSRQKQIISLLQLFGKTEHF